MLGYTLRRIIYTMPVLFGVSVVCFALVHISPGDPLISILPADASVELQDRLRVLYGFDRLSRAVRPVAGPRAALAIWAHPSPRAVPVAEEVLRAVGNTLMLAAVATLIGFALGCLFGFVAGYFAIPGWTRRPRRCLSPASACRITGWAWCW
jgi:peptide/nickel transport system permease protein